MIQRPAYRRIQYLPVLLAATLFFSCTRQLTTPMTQPLFTIPFDSNPNQTLTYPEIIDCYRKMAAAYPTIFRLTEAGTTDIGEPLHLAILSTGGQFDPASIRQAGKQILFINNGIHPGEPEGIDAAVMLLRDLLAHPERREVLNNLVLVLIPVYNVDGCLNRNSHTRANQNGPESYGFRGNTRNFDLNRDFVKCDTKNAQSFNHIFRTWNPDVFIDNHTSNGADYQYIVTLIATQHNKLEKPLDDFLQQTMLPELYRNMAQKGFEMTPYVDGPGDTPDAGLTGFMDYARYSTGYAALWNTIGFMPETHMLKPFADRVHGTYAFMETTIRFVHEHARALAEARQKAVDLTRTKAVFPLDYTLDTARHTQLTFKGYAAKYKPSEVSGLPRLWYDRSEPFTKQVLYYNEYQAISTAEKPYAYIIPQGWGPVAERLQLNGVTMHRLSRETTVATETYFIRDFKTRNAWEGHYYHYGVKMEKQPLQRTFRKGDWVVYLDQDANRYLIETLEPNAPDSWLAWNFFESILMQKEYFSDYVFEDTAADLLKNDPKLKAELDAKKKEDPKFANDGAAQLDWVYRHSPWYEPTHRLYPVARILTPVDLPTK